MWRDDASAKPICRGSFDATDGPLALSYLARGLQARSGREDDDDVEWEVKGRKRNERIYRAWRYDLVFVEMSEGRGIRGYQSPPAAETP